MANELHKNSYIEPKIHRKRRDEALKSVEGIGHKNKLTSADFNDLKPVKGAKVTKFRKSEDAHMARQRERRVKKKYDSLQFNKPKAR